MQVTARAHRQFRANAIVRPPFPKARARFHGQVCRIHAPRSHLYLLPTVFFRLSLDLPDVSKGVPYVSPNPSASPGPSPFPPAFSSHLEHMAQSTCIISHVRSTYMQHVAHRCSVIVAIIATIITTVIDVIIVVHSSYQVSIFSLSLYKEQYRSQDPSFTPPRPKGGAFPEYSPSFLSAPAPPPGPSPPHTVTCDCVLNMKGIMAHGFLHLLSDDPQCLSNTEIAEKHSSCLGY